MSSNKSFLKLLLQVSGHSDRDSKQHRDICKLHHPKVQMGAMCLYLGPDPVTPYGEVTP